LYNTHREQEALMRTYPLHEARADFSKLMDRALAGEPQRVTRYGKEAVVIVAEAAWNKRPKSAASLGDLLADFGETIGFDEDLWREQPWTDERPLGSDFSAE